VLERADREEKAIVTGDNAQTNRRPLILAVTSELPWPLNTGGHLRSFHVLRTLSRHFRVRVVAGVVPGQEASVEAIRAKGIDLEPAPLHPRVLWREGLRTLKAAVLREPYALYRRHDRRAVRRTLREQVRRETPDVLYLDHLDSLLYRPLLPRTPSVIDLHNVYSLILQRSADEQTRWLARRYLLREANLLQRMEKKAAETVDVLFSVSDEERAYFEALGVRSLYVVPNGVDCSAYEALPTGRGGGPPTILYLGTMSWSPNAKAAQFLAADVLPKVRERLPDARLTIVGRDPPPELLALRERPGVEITGGVPDVMLYLRQAHVLAVPLETGGGTRLKILEAFAAGLPVVSTPIGAEGIRANDREHLLIAPRERFAASTLEVLADEGLRQGLAERARVSVRQLYDWTTVGEVACTAIATLVEGRRERTDAPQLTPLGA
jgi:glycosyltransferase involved in cell wall biosynthesis